ncbi:hypothetical protein DPMN_027319 [Dreissena polymorpha]|uniref:Uncharacterized protein n=1 Tax=Dreissena polymorpha TaxID=45954 RepID=A0A9D4LV30_DREPO|nr:hypothetical protein DPMN_027319 [Dreissena polymorpha]
MFDVTGRDSLVSVHSSILENLSISGVCEIEEEPRVSVPPNRPRMVDSQTSPMSSTTDNTSRRNSFAGDSFIKIKDPPATGPTYRKIYLSELANLVAEKLKDHKNALKVLKKNPAEHNLLYYRSLENQAKRVILDAKTQNWKELCYSAIINKKNTRDFWQKIHRIKGNSFTPVPLLKYKGEIATTPREKAQCLVRHFQSVSSD